MIQELNTNEGTLVMGGVYRRKRRSCSLCKPNKMGWAPARSDKELPLREDSEWDWYDVDIVEMTLSEMIGDEQAREMFPE